jgi:prepilin peptidase CpaA
MSQLELVQFGCLIAFALLLLVAAWQDLRTLRIADGVSVAIVVVFGVWTAAGLAAGTFSMPQLGIAIAFALALFLAGAAAFALGMVGGGDVKLGTAASLFAAPAHLADFLTVTALTGGIVALAVIMARAPRGPADERGEAALRGHFSDGLPYGPAIAAGGLWVAATLAAR